MKKVKMIMLLVLAGVMTAAAQDKTFVLTEGGMGHVEQTWFYSGTGKDIDKATIKKHWDEGKYITSAAYTKNGWFLCMSKDPDYTTQSYTYTSNFPKDWIKEKYNAGYVITDISCNKSNWMVVMSKHKKMKSQVYKWGSSTDLKPWFLSRRDEGYMISGVTYSNGKWLWVMTKNTNYSTQGYKFVAAGDLKTTIQNLWDEGQRIQLVEYGGGKYMVIYGKLNTGTVAQGYFTKESGFSDWAKKEWNAGKYIHYIGGGNSGGASSTAVASNSSKRNLTSNGKTIAEQGNLDGWRQELPNGYALWKLNPDGVSYTVTSHTRCNSCNGNKDCPICFGMGGRSYNGLYYPCKSCGGTLKCKWCNGTGESFMVSTVQNGVATGIDNNGNVYSTGGGSSSTSRSSSSSSRSSSGGRDCPGCGGSGRGTDFIKYGPNYTGTTTYEYCSKCGKNMPSNHYHDQRRCSVCGGSGKVNH